MALTEREEVSINVTGEFNFIGVKCVTIIERDGVEISRTPPHSHVVSAGDDLSGQCADVQAIAAALHTPEIIAAYQAHLAQAGV